MRIIKVIVDEVPNSCLNCPRFDFDFKGLFKRERPYCLITGGDILIDYKKSRPDWCPLINEARNYYDVSVKIWGYATGGEE
jgi:hypothetical protein